ncbi:MAG: glutaminyl-peptide cyclotransferase [Bacteroidota bacterium]
MKYTSILFIAATALFVYSCKDSPKTQNQGNNTDITLFLPGAYNYSTGDTIHIHAKYPPSVTVDSVVYSLDSVRIGSVKDSSYIHILTDTLPLGTKLVSAKIYQGGKTKDTSTNIYIKAAKDPGILSFKVMKKFPHDPSAYTEGLSYSDGYLYESTGKPGHCEIRKVDLETGKVLQRQQLDDKYFGKGNVIVGDKIVVFAYKQDKLGFVFDKNTLKPLGQFNNKVGVQSWGGTFDGNKIYLDDSSNRIWFLDKNDHHKTGFIDVFDNHGPVEKIGELEYIDDKIYANIYFYDTIIIINPKTGTVLQSINLENLWPIAERPKGFDSENNVLNGIAWDAKGKRLFLTGKKWPWVYQVEVTR